MWVHFEDMKEDLEACVRRVATFIGADESEENIARAVEQSSYAFMSANADKFNENLSKEARNVACGELPYRLRRCSRCLVLAVFSCAQCSTHGWCGASATSMFTTPAGAAVVFARNLRPPSPGARSAQGFRPMQGLATAR